MTDKALEAPAAGSATHTPGPWKSNGYVVRGDNEMIVAEAWTKNPHWPADMNLIAAAPALADALDSLCRFIADSLENRRMDSMALEMEWHKANDILRAAGRLP